MKDKHEHFLFRVRKRIGISRKKLSEYIGLSEKTLGNIENGLFESLSTRTICSIMDFLECNYDIAVGLMKDVTFDDDNYYNKIRRKIETKNLP